MNVSQPISTPALHVPYPALRRVMVDDTIAVWLGSSTQRDLDLLPEALGLLPQHGRRILLLWPDENLRPESIARVAEALRAEDRLILVGEYARLFPMTASQPTQLEPNPKTALVASMMLLAEGEALVALAPDSRSLALLRSAICLGSRWRMSWDEAEGGEFYANPRPLDLPWQRLLPPGS